MSKEILEQLFDSPIKVRLLKFFLRNPEESFNVRDIARKIRADVSSCQHQLDKLNSIRVTNSRRRTNQKFYSINRNFDFYNELAILVLKSSPASKKKMLKDIRKIGKISLLILSGVFVNADNTRADMFIVGDNMNDRKFKRFLNDLEAEVGKEIDYVIMTADDFKYRYEMFDRFIRDVLEKSHETLINKFSFVN